MLKTFRQGQRWWTALFVVGIGGVFVFFIGIGAPLQRSASAIVQIGDRSFGFREFSRIRAQREQLYQEQLGKDFDARALGDQLDQIAIQALIERAILSEQAQSMGLTVSKAEIERSVAGADIFKGEDGRFDPEAFENWAEYEYGNQANFIREQRHEMLIQKLLRVIHSSARVSEGEARSSVVQLLEEVQIAFLVFDSSTPPDDFEPSPEALSSFFETRNTEALDLYSQRSRQYDSPEQVRASHILFSVPAAADEAKTEEIQGLAEATLKRVQADEDFAELAKELSDDPGSKAQGGDLGFFGRGQMVPEFEKAAFEREPGAIGDLVKSTFGFHILRVDEKKAASKREFEDVQEELAAEILGREAARKIEGEVAERVAAAIRDGSSLEAAARAEELDLERSGRLRRRPDGFVPNLGAAQDLMATAFQLEPGESSPRIFDVEGKLALVQLTDRFSPEPDAIEAALEPQRQSLLQEKRNAYVSTWINQRRTQLAEAGDLHVNHDLIRGS